MNTWRLIARSLMHYWRTGVAVVVGLAIACAVIVGSLVIGDSVRGSIRDTALARLGKIDYALAAPHFFRQQLAADMMRDSRLAGRVKAIVPAVITRGAVSGQTTDATVPNAGVIGTDDSFWSLWPGRAKMSLSQRQAAISRSLARDLGANIGDSILVSVDKQSAIPGGTLFERRSREDTVSSLRLEIAAILPDDGPGGFKLDSGTETPRNVFVSREWLCEQIGKQGKANALLAVSGASGDQLKAALQSACALPDYGLKVVVVRNGNYLSIQSDSVLLGQGVLPGTRRWYLADGQRFAYSSVYLATGIGKRGSPVSIPYSIAAALTQPISPFVFRTRSGKASQTPADGDVWLNSWAADDLRARVGDKIELRYLISNPDGTYREGSIILTLSGIVEMTGPAADRGLVPVFEGISDTERMDEWNAPFPVDMSRIRPKDEDYWNRYKTIPKAFVSVATASELWKKGSAQIPSGIYTSVQVRPLPGDDLTQAERKLTLDMLASLKPEENGMVFRPVRKAAIDASAGTTDFGQLFLGMSLFLVIAGAGLAGTLMRLSAERRASEAGIMMACGFDERRTGRALFGEGLCLTMIGVALGVPLGMLYAAGVIAALRSWWIGAVGTSALWLHLTGSSVAIGAVSGLIVGAISIYIGVSKLTRHRVLDLLAGWQSMAVLPVAHRVGRTKLVLISSLVLAIVLLVLPGQPEGAFFGGGALLLIAALACADLALARTLLGKAGTVSIKMLALRSAAANRSRSLLVIGLIAAASFMIVAVAANTRNFSRVDYTRKDSGTGGFALRAISSLPIRYDFGTPAGRAALGFAPEDEAIFENVKVYRLLMSPGDDISCLNLAKTSQPRIVGVGGDMVTRGGFGITTGTAKTGANPWDSLNSIDSDGSVPAFGDADSVMWSLHSGLGGKLPVRTEDGGSAAVTFTGLIRGSIFAGEILVSRDRFPLLFPSVTAPRYFLIEAQRDRVDKVAQSLRQNLGDMGMEVRSTREILNSYASVQNTYLSVFLALGGLGLLLGTFGLIAMVLRGALERRREFALMLATGLTSGHLSRLLMMENAGLLVYGLACGTVAALVAVAPHVLSTESGVGWGMIFLALAVIAIAGLASCAIAAKFVVKGALVEALREE